MPPHNPFDEDQHLDSTNPFDSSSPADPSNPFSTSHGNESAFSLESSGTARPGPRGGIENIQAYASHHAGVAATLDARAAELDERERRLRAREVEVDGYKPNFPPFVPFIHHDIAVVPTQHQPTVKLLFYLWLALAATLVVNLLACIFLLIAGSSEGGADVAAAGGYLPVIGLASFALWYWPIYQGYKRAESRGMAFFFYMYFLFAGFHLLYSVYMVIGIPSTGSGGLINTISMFAQHHILAAVFCILSSLGWILQAVGGGLLYKRVWDYKNGNEEINFNSAKQEMKQQSMWALIRGSV